MSIIVRSLEKKDASLVAPLILQLTKNIVEAEHLVGRIESLVGKEQSHFLVAESNGVVVGFGGIAWYAIPSKRLIGWVEEMVVDEKYRGQGIGRQLMEALLAIAKEKGIKQLKLTSTGDVAGSLYKALGFIEKNHQYMVKIL